MIDAVVYIDSLSTLVDHVSTYHSDLLARDDNDEIASPPEFEGVSNIPLAIADDRAIAYVRIRKEDVDLWRSMPSFEILAEAKFVGEGTAKQVYDQLFADPKKLEKYDSVYSREPIEVTDGEGNKEIITPSDWVGVLAGA